MPVKTVAFAILLALSGLTLAPDAAAHTSPDATGAPGGSRLNCDPATTCNLVWPAASTIPLFAPATDDQLAAACEMFDRVPKEYSGTASLATGDPYVVTSRAGVMHALDGNLLVDCTSPTYTLHGLSQGSFDGGYEAGVGGATLHMNGIGDPYGCNWRTVDYSSRRDSAGGGRDVITVGDKLASIGFSVVFRVGVNGNVPTTTPDPTDLSGHGNVCARDNAITPEADCTDFMSGDYRDQTYNSLIGSNMHGALGDGTIYPESFGGLGPAPYGSLEAVVTDEESSARATITSDPNVQLLAAAEADALHAVDVLVEDPVEAILTESGADGTPGASAVDGTVDVLLGDESDSDASAMCPLPNLGGGHWIGGYDDPMNGEVIVFIETLLQDANGVLSFYSPTTGHVCVGNGYPAPSWEPWLTQLTIPTGNGQRFAAAQACAASRL